MLAIPASASATFSYGVQASEVKSTSATLWAHSDSSGAVTAEVNTSKAFKTNNLSFPGTASAGDDNTVQVNATGLIAGKKYYYRFKMGTDTSVMGKFATPPAVDKIKTIRFGISGDADAEPDPTLLTPFYNNFEVYGMMAAEKNQFNINLGDTIYSDTEVPGGGPVALTVADKWAKYKQNLALPNLQNLRSTGAMYNHWDDHEFVNDFSVAENGSGLYDDGKKAFQNYMAADYSGTPGLGLYRTARWGKNLEVFFLDERSFRDAKASEGGVCDNPSTPGVPDLAPTAPAFNRGLFSGLVPQLATPPPAACLTRINDPGRTFLGATQLAKFKADVLASDARFKAVITETPIEDFYALPYDRWEGYAAERSDLISYLNTNVKNVFFLATDTHANFVTTVRQSSLPFPAGISNMKEVVTGPVATMTFAKEINGTVGSPTAAEAIRGSFFKPSGPIGVGMDCASIDVFSYSEVKVTKNQVQITPKDGSKKPVKEPNNGPKCGPVKINYIP